MGRQPRSGDIPWLTAHSILNWIGGDTAMLILFTAKSRGYMHNSALPNPRACGDCSCNVIICNEMQRFLSAFDGSRKSPFGVVLVFPPPIFLR
jgi:hypothetical protein